MEIAEAVAVSSPERVATAGPSTRHPGAGAERDQLVERLISLRALLPAFAEEAASARRQAAALRLENRQLVAEIRRLQRERTSGPT